MNQEEKEWIRAEIQAIRQLIKEREERLQRKAEIRAVKRRIWALDKEERNQTEKREISKGSLVVEVLCYPREGEALEEDCIKTKNVFVQSMQQEAKRIEHIETYMHIDKVRRRMKLQIASL